MPFECSNVLAKLCSHRDNVLRKHNFDWFVAFFVVVALLGFATISFSDCFDKIYNSIWHTSMPIQMLALNRVFYVEYGFVSLRYSGRLRGCNDDLCVFPCISIRNNNIFALELLAVFGWKLEFIASINTYSVIFFLYLHGVYVGMWAAAWVPNVLLTAKHLVWSNGNDNDNTDDNHKNVNGSMTVLRLSLIERCGLFVSLCFGSLSPLIHFYYTCYLLSIFSTQNK